MTADDLRQLVSRWEQQPDHIVAALYDDTIGVPAIFPADLFRELAELTGDRGARVLLSRYPERVIGVPMPSAAQDIDTPGDLACRHAVLICARVARQLLLVAVTTIQSNATGVVSRSGA